MFFLTMQSLFSHSQIQSLDLNDSVFLASTDSIDVNKIGVAESPAHVA